MTVGGAVVDVKRGNERDDEEFCVSFRTEFAWWTMLKDEHRK